MEREESLTYKERARLLAAMDFHNQTEEDKALYDKLKSIPEPGPEDTDSKTRLAIAHYVSEMLAGLLTVALNDDQDPLSMELGGLTEMLIVGYRLGKSGWTIPDNPAGQSSDGATRNETNSLHASF